MAPFEGPYGVVITAGPAPTLGVITPDALRDCPLPSSPTTCTTFGAVGSVILVWTPVPGGAVAGVVRFEGEDPPRTTQRVVIVDPFRLAYTVTRPFARWAAIAGAVGGVPGPDHASGRRPDHQPTRSALLGAFRFEFIAGSDLVDIEWLVVVGDAGHEERYSSHANESPHSVAPSEDP